MVIIKTRKGQLRTEKLTFFMDVSRRVKTFENIYLYVYIYIYIKGGGYTYIVPARYNDERHVVDN